MIYPSVLQPEGVELKVKEVRLPKRVGRPDISLALVSLIDLNKVEGFGCRLIARFAPYRRSWHWREKKQLVGFPRDLV